MLIGCRSFVLCAALCVSGASSNGAIVVEDEVSLRNALFRPQTTNGDKWPLRVAIHGTIALTAPLELFAGLHDGVTLEAASARSGITLAAGSCHHVIHVAGASSVQLFDLHVILPATTSRHCEAAAIAGIDASHLLLSGLTIVGGVHLEGGAHNALAWSDVSNVHGSNNGSCVAVTACGNATTLETCNTTIHDNKIHDCRIPPKGSPYDAVAQGVLLGGGVGAAECTVGVVVTHNQLENIDSFGVRINNDNYYPCVLNQVVFNAVTNWGQSPSTDAGCLYMYGHWFSPGNNFSFNYCHATNKSWGQNGIYLDDVATGQTLIGNVYRGGGSPIKMNGGAYNTFDSLVVVEQGSLGFGNCRGLRGSPQEQYTCESSTGQRWLKILTEVDFLGPLWHARWPFYTGWCSNTTAGNGSSCAPPGAPPTYECAVLSRGNALSNFAGIAMTRNSTFGIQTGPGFPDGTGVCPMYVVTDNYNSIRLIDNPFFGAGEFVDYDGGDLTLRSDSAVYKAMPDFVRIPFNEIGVRSEGRGGNLKQPTPTWKRTAMESLPTWSWDTISTWCFPCFSALPLTATQLAWYAKFDMVDQCCSGLEKDSSGSYIQNAVDTALNFSRELKANKSNTFFSPYIGMEMGQNYYPAMAEWNHDLAHSAQWLKFSNGTAMTCDADQRVLCPLLQVSMNGTHVYDWRADGMIDYWIKSIVNPFLSAAEVDGVFFDDIYTICEHVSSGVNAGWFAAADAADFCDAAFTALAATADAFAAAHKLPIFSIKGDESNVSAYNRSRYAEVVETHGGMAYFEYWNSWPGQPREESLLQFAMELGQAGVPMQMHAGPTTSGPCNTSTTFPLAMFLVAAAEHSYFAYGSGWNPSTEQSLWLPEYDQPLGKPLGPGTQVAPHTYTREFEHLSVWVNMSDCTTAKITPKLKR